MSLRAQQASETSLAFIERRMAERLEEAKRRYLSSAAIGMDYASKSTAPAASAPSYVGAQSLRDFHKAEAANSPSDRYSASRSDVLAGKNAQVVSAPRLSSPSVVHSSLWFHANQHHQLVKAEDPRVAAPVQRGSINDDPSRGEEQNNVCALTTQRALFSSEILSPVRPAPVLLSSPAAVASPICADDVLVNHSADQFGHVERCGTALALHQDDAAAPRLPHRVSLTVDDVPSVRSFWITVWPGYYRAAQPTRVCVCPKTTFFQTVLERAAAATRCTPAPSCLYTPCGKVVRDIHELVASGHYLIAPSAVRYHQDMVPNALLEELVRAAKATVTGR